MRVSRRLFLGSIALPMIAKKPAGERPNILLVVVHGLPAWMIGAYGNQEVKTPNIDRLALTGTRFSNSFVCSPAAGLSHATLLSGRTPMQLGDSQPANGSGFGQLLEGAGYTVHSAGMGAAIGLIDQQAAGKPFCIAAFYSNFEPPYDQADPKYRELYASAKFETLNLARAAAANAQLGKDMLADIIGNMRKAAAVVSAIDDEVGAMVAKLAQKRMLENTLIVFTSTCGSMLGRHGLWDSGDASAPVNMYEEAMVVPLIWSWLGRVPAQAVRPELVSTYDFVPTLCELVDAEAAAHLCGRSYLALAEGKALPKKQPWRKTVFGHYRNTEMARIERYKLVQRDAGKGPGELYDLIADPNERDNQYNNEQFLTVRTTLSQSLAAWKQQYSA